MLVTLKEIMDIAEEKKIAVGSFNASCLEAIEAELEAAEELKLPVIIQFAQCHEPWIPLTTIGPIMVEMAKQAVQLAVELWSNRHSAVLTSELVKAIINDEPIRHRDVPSLLHGFRHLLGR